MTRFHLDWGGAGGWGVPDTGLVESPGTVLVEGESDRLAVITAMRRRGLDPDAYRVVAMGGVTNIGRHLRELTAERDDVLVAGLCDAGEEGVVVRALGQAGFGTALDRWDLAALGFFVCVQDLEDELIRALGIDAALTVVEAEHELGAFRTMRQQLAQRDRAREQQLHRFLGSGSGRKIRYAPLFVEALPDGALPEPLAGLVEHLGRWGAG